MFNVDSYIDLDLDKDLANPEPQAFEICISLIFFTYYIKIFTCHVIYHLKEDDSFLFFFLYFL